MTFFKTHFHKKGFALGLVLRVRVFGTRKWPIKWHNDDGDNNIDAVSDDHDDDDKYRIDEIYYKREQ